MISTEQEEIAKEANEVIEIAKKCITTGEGMWRHKTHYFSNHSRKCECGDKNLDRYAEMMNLVNRSKEKWPQLF